MQLHRSNAILFAAVLAGVLLVSTLRDAGTPALAQPAVAPAARWQVVTIERKMRRDQDGVARDAILVDGDTGQTWIMTNAEGLKPAWERVPQK